MMLKRKTALLFGQKSKINDLILYTMKMGKKEQINPK
jgi:hypothetical protein